MIILLSAVAFLLPVQEEKKSPDDEARAAIAEYKERRKKNTEDDFIAGIGILKDAKPHKLIRTELASIVESRYPYSIRTEAAEALGRYKKDLVAADLLLRRAREERAKDAADFRKRCLRSFGDIAPFGKSADLLNLYNDPDTSVARAAVEAAEKIGSVRSLKALVAQLGELERIREDDGGDPGPGVPGGGGPGTGDNNSRKKRKEDLLEPTKSAIRTIIEKVDSKRKVANYTEANRALNELRGKIKEKQEEEDAEDKKP
jgi:hypothetical protein